MAPISGDVENSIAYTMDLKGPKYMEVFPDQKIDAAKSCGEEKNLPDPLGDSCRWQLSGRTRRMDQRRKCQGAISRIFRTDKERVSFRYYDVLADKLYAWFPPKQALRPKREDLRPGPLGTTHGYIGSPIVSAFSHAPYLHNGSIATMAELINLKPRRNLFYRGDNIYDPIDLGLIVPTQPDAKRYFKFDTAERGNSNLGHDYPWSYKGPGWDEASLKEYPRIPENHMKPHGI